MPINNPSLWQDLQKRQNRCQQRRAQLMGRQQTLAEQRERIVAEVSAAQARVDAADFVKEILERLQKREHERAVGAYEQLLGAFLSDVLPGDREVVMDLHTERGAPSLDLYIRKGEGAPLEDAWLGTGGSVTNLLSTGLRLIALLRSGRKRFLVLDESDCWIKPDLIPQYASVVSQMAKDLGVQILMISHHDESLFQAHIPHRLKMVKQGSNIQVEWSPTSQIPTWDVEQDGMRSMALRDFQSHQNTYIPFSPTITLLQGDNDIGKSAVVNALRAVFDGDANESMIKHHAAMAQISFDFGPEHTLIWKRFKKGKVRCSYTLQSNDTQEILHSTDGTKVPEWLTDHLKIGRIDGLDVQIGQQQSPVFLLDQPASQRAKALAVGQESGHVMTMMALEKQEIQDCKTVVKTGERELERSRHEMQILEGMGKGLDPIALDELMEKHSKTQKRQDVLMRWTQTQEKNGCLQLLQTQQINVTLPTLRSKKMRHVWSAWSFLGEKIDILSNLPTPTQAMPTLTSPKLAHLFNIWSEKFLLSQTFNLLKQKQPHSLPILHAPILEKLYTRWCDRDQARNILSALSKSPPMTFPVKMAGKSANVFRIWSRQVERFEILSQNKILQTDKVPEPSRSTYQKINQDWIRWGDDREKIEKAIISEQEQEKEILQQVHAISPTCPTCQRSWGN